MFERIAGLLFGCWILLWLLSIIGWIANTVYVIKLFPNSEWTITEILQVVGIIAAPLGSVLGWVALLGGL